MILNDAKIPTGSKTSFLDNILNCRDFTARLFVNDIDETQINLQFVEASFENYSQYTLEKTRWLPSVLDANNNPVSTYKDFAVWVNRGDSTVNVHGYYVTDSSGVVCWYQKFDLPVAIQKDQGINIEFKVILGSPVSQSLRFNCDNGLWNLTLI